MCYTGGPRCPKEALRKLSKAEEAWKENPSLETKEAYFQELHQYHLTKPGLEALLTEAKEAEEKGLQKKADIIFKKHAERAWERETLIGRNKVAKQLTVLVEATGHPQAQETLENLIGEGSPFANPSREILERWAESTGQKLLPYDGAQFYAIRNLRKRLDYQDLVNSLDATEISPPGSQADQYPRDSEGKISEVYYASYGSNMSKERFMAYIQGGSVKGAKRVYNGATDPTEPTDDIPLKFPNPVQYAGNSKVWGTGGVGFLDHNQEGQSLGRAYRVTAQQFSDVVAQESGEERNYTKTDVDKAVENGTTYDYSRLYGTLVHVGDYNGCPVLTFTAPFGVEDAYYGDAYFDGATPKVKGQRFYSHAPSKAYMRMIGQGLAETFGLSKEEQATYFVGSPGANKYSKASVLDALTWVPEDEASVRESRPARRGPEVKRPRRSVATRGRGKGRITSTIASQLRQQRFDAPLNGQSQPLFSR